MNFPANLKYTKSHEWLKKTAEGTVQIGLTDHAQNELGDLVFVNLPSVGDALTVGESFADVESVKAVSDVFSPVTAVVAAVNELLLDDPAMINTDCYDAWLIEAEGIELEDELLNAEEYEAFIQEEA
ncbi:glycine cleavage system protein GcvH [Ruminococcaceae bacterium OttesenSCG-928-A16]|nr:glycine cleavage system protein GcvH [Ruminococcaceae bacterium OttesenSCG-928-A16]